MRHCYIRWHSGSGPGVADYSQTACASLRRGRSTGPRSSTRPSVDEPSAVLSRDTDGRSAPVRTEEAALPGCGPSRRCGRFRRCRPWQVTTTRGIDEFHLRGSAEAPSSPNEWSRSKDRRSFVMTKIADFRTTSESGGEKVRSCHEQTVIRTNGQPCHSSTRPDIPLRRGPQQFERENTGN